MLNLTRIYSYEFRILIDLFSIIPVNQNIKKDNLFIADSSKVLGCLLQSLFPFLTDHAVYIQTTTICKAANWKKKIKNKNCMFRKVFLIVSFVYFSKKYLVSDKEQNHDRHWTERLADMYFDFFLKYRMKRFFMKRNTTICRVIIDWDT